MFRRSKRFLNATFVIAILLFRFSTLPPTRNIIPLPFVAHSRARWRSACPRTGLSCVTVSHFHSARISKHLQTLSRALISLFRKRFVPVNEKSGHKVFNCDRFKSSKLFDWIIGCPTSLRSSHFLPILFFSLSLLSLLRNSAARAPLRADINYLINHSAREGSDVYTAKMEDDRFAYELFICRLVDACACDFEENNFPPIFFFEIAFFLARITHPRGCASSSARKLYPSRDFLGQSLVRLSLCCPRSLSAHGE